MKKTILLLFTLVALFLFGCSQATVTQAPEKQGDKLTVVTTLFPLYEFAREIGGDNVDVTLLLPPGVEPHSFEPKPSDIKKIENADAFLYIGEIMEPWAHDILEGLSNKDLQVVDASSLVTLLESNHDDHDEHGHEEHGDEHDHAEDHAEEHHDEEHGHDHKEEDLMHDEHDHEDEHGDEGHMHDEHEEEGHDHHNHGAFDPHIWLDLEKDQKIVAEIAKVFSLLDNANADVYQTNANAYIAKLIALDERYKTELASCSHDEFLVGGHNFFGYIEHRYNIEGIPAIENLAPKTEPTPKRIQEITDIANEHGIKHILTEVLVSKQMAEAIASESGAEVLVFHPAPNLPKADLDRGVTFLSVMEENLETLKTALECS